MSLDRDQSFSQHPNSDRYWRLLNGSSVASVRMDQGLSSAGKTAGKMARSLKGRRAASKERKQTRQGIERGEIQDLS